MVIQPLLFPPKHLIGIPELFFRGAEPANISDASIFIPAGSEISLETYFNAFSVGKWVKYTLLDNLSLYFEAKGDIEIKAYHAVGSTDNRLFAKDNIQAYKATREAADVHITHENDVYTVVFNKLYTDGIICVTIKALKNATLYGGGYETKIDSSLLNPIKLAVGICTFKREEAVLGNVSQLAKGIVGNSKSPLYKNLEIYIADNGQTLDSASFDSNKVHIYPNLNLGGAGGFTRTMIEAMLSDKEKAFTHIIFMDDDITLYPPILERTYHLLQLLKNDYRKALVGASMLLSDRPYLQQNCGCLALNRFVRPSIPNHHFFDLRDSDAIAANEVQDPINYTGWYFTCIPASIINQNNLPMPLFIHNDDVEYGMRNNTNGLILLNGIGVWHPAVEKKGGFWISYYDTRNRFIVLFVNDVSLRDLKHHLFELTKKFLLKIVQYQYQDAYLMISAMQDFLKGSDALIQMNALQKHSELLKSKYQAIAPSDVGITEEDICRKRYPNFKNAFLIQLLCNLLPPVDKTRAADINFFDIPYRAKKFYIFNPKDKSGFLFERNQKMAFALLLAFYKAKRQIIKQHKNLIIDWKKGQKIMTSLPFWEKYLGIKRD